MKLTRRKNLSMAKMLAYIRQHHLRNTPERRAVLQKAVELGSEFSPADIHAALEGEGYHVTRATIYSTLSLLDEAQVVRRVTRYGSTPSGVLYEIIPERDARLTTVCRRCGSEEEIRDPELTTELLEMRLPQFVVNGFHLHLWGVCALCRSGGRRKRRT